MVGWVVVLGCYSGGEAGETKEGVDYWDYGTAFVDGEGAVLEIVSRLMVMLLERDLRVGRNPPAYLPRVLLL